MFVGLPRESAFQTFEHQPPEAIGNVKLFEKKIGPQAEKMEYKIHSTQNL